MSFEAEIVTKAEAARRWGVSRTAVSKYVAKGMPVRSDGCLDWPLVDVFRNENNVPERSGNFRFRSPGVDVSSPLSSQVRSGEFYRGAAKMASSINASARRAWPTFVSQLHVDHLSAEGGTAIKITLTAAVLYLLERWVEDYSPEPAPPVDWAGFGVDAEIAAQCDALMEEWRRTAF
jgi:hypothetical protein